VQGDALERTIDVHVGRLREKLGEVADHPRYIATVRGAGYRAVDRDASTLPSPGGRGK
jgi:DNA-binding response OmpR family regulator